MNSRRTMPQYAQYDAVVVTQGQFRHICKGRTPGWAKEMSYRDSIAITRTKDGVYWGEWRSSVVFWANRWYRIPKTVGDRAYKIKEFVTSL